MALIEAGQAAFVCSNKDCGAVWAVDPEGHCPMCCYGGSWSTMRRRVLSTKPLPPTLAALAEPVGDAETEQTLLLLSYHDSDGKPLNANGDQASTLIRRLASSLARAREALDVPAVWSEGERLGMIKTFEKASAKHGLSETLFAVGAWLLRHRQRALATLTQPEKENMQPVQIFAFTASSVPEEIYVRFLQAFKLPNGNIELRLRNGDGIVNTIEISTDEAMTLSLALGAAKFPHSVVAGRANR